MEAANRGAHEAGGVSLGCNIQLPREQKPNGYLNKFIQFEHFFARKAMLVKSSCAFVVMPCGFGTLDEAFEIATLMQNHKLERFPLIACGRAFWDKFVALAQDAMLKEGTASLADLEFVLCADSADEVVRIVREGDVREVPGPRV